MYVCIYNQMLINLTSYSDSNDQLKITAVNKV